MELRMGREQAGGAGKPEVPRSESWKTLGAAAFMAASVLAAWQLQGWVEAHTGLGGNLAILLASIPGAALMVLGGKLLLKPSRDPHVRWLSAERMRAFERKVRPWGAAFLVLLLLREFIVLLLCRVDAPLIADGAPFAWAFAAVVVSAFSELVPQGRDEEFPPSERLRAERQKAVRLGYLVVMALGVVNIMAAGSWPLVAARAWVSILLLGLLVPKVWLMVVDRTVESGA